MSNYEWLSIFLNTLNSERDGIQPHAIFFSKGRLHALIYPEDKMLEIYDYILDDFEDLDPEELAKELVKAAQLQDLMTKKPNFKRNF